MTIRPRRRHDRVSHDYRRAGRKNCRACGASVRTTRDADTGAWVNLDAEPIRLGDAATAAPGAPLYDLDGYGHAVLVPPLATPLDSYVYVRHQDTCKEN